MDYYSAFGERKNLNRWAKDPRCHIHAGTLAGRIKKGWDVETAITTPGKYPVPLREFGEEKLCLKWSNDPRCQVKWATLAQRIARGWAAEYAIALSSMMGHDWRANSPLEPGENLHRHSHRDGVPLGAHCHQGSLFKR